MAASIKFDVVRRARVVYNLKGITINRQLIVYDIPIAAGDSDPEILLKCFGVSGFPTIGSAYPSSGFSYASLDEIQIDSIDQNTSAVEVTLIYRGALIVPDPSGGIAFTITQQTTQSSVQTGMTADGQQALEAWYLGSAAGGVANPTPNAQIFHGTVQKIKCAEILRASATCTKAQWDAVKPDIRAAIGKVNSVEWGGFEQGYWLFLGPSTRTLDSAGLTLFVQLDFAGDKDLWYRFMVYRDPNGRIPPDIDTEAVLRANGVPGDGGMAEGKGLSWVSVQQETDFNPLFGFTPD